MNRARRWLLLGTALLWTGAACASSARRSPADRAALFEKTFTEQELHMLSAAAHDVVRQQLPPGLGCVAILGPSPGRIEPSDGFLRRMSPEQPLVRRRDCAAALMRLAATSDSLRRSGPTLQAHPYYLDFGRPQFDRADHAYFTVRELYGTRGREFTCVADGADGGAVRCTVVSQWLIY